MSTGPQFYALSARTVEEIEGALKELQVRTKSRCAFVLDRTGCILASCGDFFPLKPETMGAIAAAAIAALNHLVARAESREVSIRFYGAAVERIHFALITDRLILTLVHPHNASGGTIRSGAKAFIQKVRPAVEREQTHPSTLQSFQYIEDKLSEIFKDPNSHD